MSTTLAVIVFLAVWSAPILSTLALLARYVLDERREQREHTAMQAEIAGWS